MSSDDKKEQPVNTLPTSKKYKTQLRQVMIDIDDNPNYKLIQLRGSQRDEFLMNHSKRYYDSKGVLQQRLQDPKGLQAFLISLCLHDPMGNCVPVEVIQSWPAEMVTDLYDDCVLMNGLGEKARDVGKNDSLAKADTGTPSPTV